MRKFPVGLIVAGLLAASSAQAQRSLFDQAPVDPSGGFTPAAPAPSPALTPPPSAAQPPARAATPQPSRAPVSTEAPAASAEPIVRTRPRRAAKPKPKVPQPAGALTFANGSTSIITAIVIEAEGNSINYAKELAPDGKAVVKLPRLKGCTVSVTTTYGTDAPNLPSEVDICRDKIVKLTD